MARRSFIHEIEARERRGRWFPSLAGLIAIAVLASTWVGLFSFMGANAAHGTVTDVEDAFIPDVEAMPLAFPDLSRVSRVFASDGEQLAELHDGRVSEPVPYEEVPRVVRRAILAAEDSEFFIHRGIDFQAIMSAAVSNLVNDTLIGGSTITQQVVKKNFVGEEVSLKRKITEAFVANELERRYEKEQILEFYMNSVYFGYGAYGVKSAADEYYHKSLDQLTVPEAATLAVLVRNPTYYDARRSSELVEDRRNDVLDEMVESGWLTESDAETFKAQPLGIKEHVIERGAADHVVAEIKRQLLDLDRHEFDFLGTTKEARKKAIFGCPADDTTCAGGGGLRIESTIDLEAQNKAIEILNQYVPFPDAETNLALCEQLAGPLKLDTEEKINNYAAANSCAPTGAISTVESETGAVRVMASGLPFEVDQFDLATQGRRNPGSSFKPFTLMAALESPEDITLGSHYRGSSPLILECPYQCSELGNKWKVSNAGGSRAVMSLEQATSSSVNVVYAQVALEVGPEAIVDMAHRMGVKSELRAVPSITLGTSEVTPLEMASAYTNFATNGRWTEPYLVGRILDASGQVIFEHQSEHIQVAKPEMFAAARRPLSKVPTSAGTAPRANIGRPQGGKTGTHQDYKDAWFVGFVPQYATAVWIGFEADQIPLTNVTINGRRERRIFGGTAPAPMWADFMGWYLQDVEPADFPGVEGSLDPYFRRPSTTVPSVVGMDRGSAASAVTKAKLFPSIVEVPSTEPEGTVIAQAPGGGATVPQGSGVTLEVSTGDPPVGVIPNVAGQGFDAALAVLQSFSAENRLELEFVRANQEVEDPSRVGTVLRLDPPAGTSVGYKAVVVIVVGVPASDSD